jgi:cell fate (sporulation/competence/biofilm development) regulator YlbF (YheA/YmcA/DUF963 family)
MESTLQDTPIIQKTKELCQVILDEPGMQSIRQRIDRFLDNTEAREQYDAVVSKGQALHEKQQNAQPLSGEEVSEFETQREALLSNEVARDFLNAQEELHQLQHTVQKYVTKTFELGRMPTEDDFCNGNGSCGSCNCH